MIIIIVFVAVGLALLAAVYNYLRVKRSDPVEDLQAFVAVVEAGSFTAAAERLDAAKSAVSRRVSALEERLGAQLLRRTTRRINLSETGKSFYERSARILADLDEAESAVAQEHGELRGTLRVALPLSTRRLNASASTLPLARSGATSGVHTPLR